MEYYTLFLLLRNVLHLRNPVYYVRGPSKYRRIQYLNTFRANSATVHTWKLSSTRNTYNIFSSPILIAHRLASVKSILHPVQNMCSLLAIVLTFRAVYNTNEHIIFNGYDSSSKKISFFHLKTRFQRAKCMQILICKDKLNNKRL